LPDNNSLEMKVKITAEGQAVIKEIEKDTKNLTEASTEGSKRIAEEQKKVVAGIVEQIAAIKNLDSAKGRQALAQLDQLDKVAAGELRAARVAEQSAAASSKAADTRDKDFRRLATAMDSANREEEKRFSIIRKLAVAQDAAAREDARRTKDAGAGAREAEASLLKLAQGAGIVDYQTLNLSRGLSGLGGSMGIVAAVAAATAVAIGTLGKAAFNLVQEQSAAERETANFAVRLGLTVTQAEKLTAAAGMTGVSIGSLEASARLLGEALEHPDAQGKKASKALHELGISTTDAAGNMAELGPVVLQVLEHLSKIPNAAQRAALANETLGRGSKALLPLIANYEELQRVVDGFHVGENAAGSEELLKADRAIKALTLSWGQFQKTLAERIAPIGIQVIEYVTRVLNGPGFDKPQEGVGRQRTQADIDVLDGGRSRYTAKFDAVALSQAQTAQRATGKAADFREADGRTKEGLEDQLKAAKEKRDGLRNVLGGGNLDSKHFDEKNAEYKEAEADIKRVTAALEAMKDAKKGAKEQDQETIALRSELANLTARELSGLEAIQAKHQGILDKLREQGKTNPLNEALLDKILKIETERYTQQVALATLSNKRNVSNASYDVTRRLSRTQAKGAAEIALAKGKYDGDEEGAIKGRYNSSLNSASGAFDDAARHIQQMRAASAERESEQHNELALNKELSDIKKAQIDASGAAAIALYGAEKNRELELANLQKKRYSDQASDLANSRALVDAITKADIGDRKAQLHLRSQLLGVNAQPGSELATFKKQSELHRQTAQLDQAERTRTIGNQITDQQALLKTNPAQAKEIEHELAKLRVEGVQNERNYQREIGDERVELELKIAQLRRQSLEEYKSFFVGLVNSGIGGGEATKRFLEGFGRSILDKVVGNVAGITFDTVRKASPQIGGQGTASNPTILGKILNGTPLAAHQDSPLIASQTKLGGSTDLLRISLDRLTGAIAQGGAGGTAGALAGGDSSASVPGNLAGLAGATPSADAGSGEAPEFDGRPPGSSGSGAGLAGKVAGGTAAVAGALTAYNGFSRGGAKGITQGVSGVLGAAAGVAALTGVGAPVALALGIAAGAVSLFSGLLGDSKAKFAKQQDKIIQQGQYLAPISTNSTVDTHGFMVDYGSNGKIRQSPFDENTINNSYLDRLHNTNTWLPIQGNSGPNLTQFGDNPLTPIRPSAAGGGQAAITVNLTVNALDSKSFLDRSGDVAMSVIKELNAGHPLGLSIQQKVLGS
jgi:hypothetical protein